MLLVLTAHESAITRVHSPYIKLHRLPINGENAHTYKNNGENAHTFKNNGENAHSYDFMGLPMEKKNNGENAQNRWGKTPLDFMKRSWH